MIGLITVSIFTGFVVGLVHVLSGPDHIAAVATFALGNRTKTWRVGLVWGMGHTSGVWVVAALAVLLKGALPIERLSGWTETLIGLTLVGIGLWGFYKAINNRIHYHEHEHDGVRHAHFHMHSSRESTHHPAKHGHDHLPFGIGALHGIAGGSHLIGIIPALVLPERMATVTFLLGFGLGSIVAMIGFSWFLASLCKKWATRYSMAYNVSLATAALVAIGVGIAWLVTSP